MVKYRVGIIGCGRTGKEPGVTGFGMAHAHAEGYKASPDCQIVALADIKLENAVAFQQKHGGDALYTDYHEMLAKENLDIVSISTWPALHGEMVIAAAEAGVKAIHCEKPMAPTWQEAVRMEQACRERGVLLTFNHQRRFDSEYRQAKALLKSGAIGELKWIEAACPDMFDWGTHWYDMLFYYNDECPVEWVIAQVEKRGTHLVFGLEMEGQAISHFRYQNGIRGFLFTGNTLKWEGFNRLVGEEGTIEVDMTRRPQLRIWGRGMSEWKPVPTEQVDANKLAVLDLVDALKTGREPELAARKALAATEMVFATYESARRGGRVELPLQLDDNPHAALLRNTE